MTQKSTVVISETVLQRLNIDRYVVDKNGCHVWQGAINEKGYGIVGTNRDGTFKAHRIAYEKSKGPVPRGYEIDHRCRNRACINADHLEVVTSSENTRRGDRAKLTPETVLRLRRERAVEGTSYRKLGAKYGITGVNALRVCRGDLWRDVPSAEPWSDEQ